MTKTCTLLIYRKHDFSPVMCIGFQTQTNRKINADTDTFFTVYNAQTGLKLFFPCQMKIKAHKLRCDFISSFTLSYFATDTNTIRYVYNYSELNSIYVTFCQQDLSNYKTALTKT